MGLVALVGVASEQPEVRPGNVSTGAALASKVARLNAAFFFMEQVLEQPAEDWNRQAAEPEPEPDGSQRRAVELEQQQPQKLRRKVEEKVGPLEREAEKAKATTRWRVTNK